MLHVARPSPAAQLAEGLSASEADTLFSSEW